MILIVELSTNRGLKTIEEESWDCDSRAQERKDEAPEDTPGTSIYEREMDFAQSPLSSQAYTEPCSQMLRGAPGMTYRCWELRSPQLRTALVTESSRLIQPSLWLKVEMPPSEKTLVPLDYSPCTRKPRRRMQRYPGAGGQPDISREK